MYIYLALNNFSKTKLVKIQIDISFNFNFFQLPTGKC